MKKVCKALVAFFLAALMLSPLGQSVGLPSTNATETRSEATTSANYGIGERTIPIDVAVYTEFADLAPIGEYHNVMDAIRDEYGQFGRLQMKNITDYAQLHDVIYDFDILLIPEQEDATGGDIDDVVAAWNPFLGDWVSDGGVLIVMSYYEGSYGRTHRILNETGLLPLYNRTPVTTHTASVTDDTDPLALGVPSTFSAPSGSIAYNTTTGSTVVTIDGASNVVHRFLGMGHVVMLGFDMYERSPATDTILCNALKLVQLVVMDVSHGQFYDPRIQFRNYTELLSDDGFACKIMELWDEDLIEKGDILMIGGSNGANYTPSEIDAIKSYTAAGGGLLLMSDWGEWGNALDPILEAFGYARDSRVDSVADTDDYGGQTNFPVYGLDNMANHSITYQVFSVQTLGGSVLTDLPDNAEAIVWMDNDGTAEWWTSGDPIAGLPIMACSTFGDGRVFVTTDNDLWAIYDYDGDGTMSLFDEYNDKLALGIMRWLMAAGIPEKTLLVDISHGAYLNFLSPTHEEFAAMLTFNGFKLRWMTSFNDTLLEQADLLLLFSGTTNHTASEKAAIASFVQRGGGFFAVGDFGHYGYDATGVTETFGLRYNVTGAYIEDSDDAYMYPSYLIYDFGNFASHPIMDGVSRIEVDRGTGFESIGTGVALVSTDTDGTAQWNGGGVASGVPIIAITEYGLGRVVAIADYNMPGLGNPDSDDYPTLYDSDNDIFLANAFYWLIENRAPVVEVLAPNGGEVLNGTRTIEWTAVDPNRDPIIFSVFVSNNNGTDWALLTDGLSVSTYSWNTTTYPDGNSYMIRVVASDGALESYDDSDGPFELDNFEETTPVAPLDSNLLLIIGVGVAVIVIVIVVFMKRPGAGKK
ncbi:MAG: hypothetical protein ACP6KW_10695 [Candidatus Thorarchaeota archaeon]